MSLCIFESTLCNFQFLQYFFFIGARTVCLEGANTIHNLKCISYISAHTPSFPSNNSVQYNRRRSATSHSTPNSPTKTRSRSEAFCTCMTTDPTLLGKSRTPQDMDRTLHTDFPKFETNRDIKTIISPFVYL